jgi:hypothetical protein
LLRRRGPVEEMIITIEDGKIAMEVAGVRGTRCLELTQAVEQMLGKIGRRLLKQDYYRTVEIKQKVKLTTFPPSGPEGKD